MLKTSISVSLASILLFISCNINGVKPVKPESKYAKYIHISHTRTSANPKMDSLAEKLNYSEYDMTWLGGDLANLTSADEETMNHVDSIYNLGSNNTLWALGNHDY